MGEEIFAERMRTLSLKAWGGLRRVQRALEVALAAINRYAPDALVVSLGVDTYAGDPISAFELTHADFATLGGRLAELALPTVLVQEGGYAIAELGDNVAAVLAAF